jgi:hypothetical protein
MKTSRFTLFLLSILVSVSSNVFAQQATTDHRPLTKNEQELMRSLIDHGQAPWDWEKAEFEQNYRNFIGDWALYAHVDSEEGDDDSTAPENLKKAPQLKTITFTEKDEKLNLSLTSENVTDFGIGTQFDERTFSPGQSFEEWLNQPRKFEGLKVYSLTDKNIQGVNICRIPYNNPWDVNTIMICRNMFKENETISSDLYDIYLKKIP